MRRVPQKQVALQSRLRDEAKLSSFEVFEAAVDKARGRRARPRPEVRLVDDEAIDALLAKVAEQSGAIDAGANDQDVNLAFRLYRRETLLPLDHGLSRGAPPRASMSGHKGFSASASRAYTA